ncbi:hypothetical protein SDC9_190953 [bioreactor metagenome]|uniref:Uncharacterized protein n=1 Tax=bioreactor metagenome TaxID=1076179 RepID=A0A645I4Q1_9ZZZZ
MEAGIFADEYLAGLERLGGGFRRLADAVSDKLHRLAEQRGQMVGGGLHRELRDHFPLRTAEVGQQHQLGTLFQNVIDGGKSGADTGIVRDLAVLERHVEVNAHDHVGALEIDVLDSLFVDIHHDIFSLK